MSIYITNCHQNKWSIGDIITQYKNKPYYMLMQNHSKIYVNMILVKFLNLLEIKVY